MLASGCVAALWRSIPLPTSAQLPSVVPSSAGSLSAWESVPVSSWLGLAVWLPAASSSSLDARLESWIEKVDASSLTAPNAALQAREAAAATQERRLFPVACKRLFGKAPEQYFLGVHYF